jgi:PAS domain S-box-containing protein
MSIMATGSLQEGCRKVEIGSNRSPQAPLEPRDHFDGRGEASLRPGSMEAEALLDLSVDWLWETDAAHRFTWVGEGCERETGIRISAILGRSRVQPMLDAAESDERIALHLRDVAARRPFRNFVQDLPVARPEGRWVMLSGLPVFDADGRFAGYRGTGRNVTAAIEAARAVAALPPSPTRGRSSGGFDGASALHARRLISALDLMTDAIAYYDDDDRIVLFNEALLVMYRGLEDVIRPGVHIEDIIDSGLARGLWDLGGLDARAWKEAFLAERGQSSFEMRFADGRWVMHRQLRTEDGGSVGICVDITAIKEKEEGAERARREAEAAWTRLQAAIDALNDGFVLWDAQDRLVACNDAFRRQFSFFPNLEVGRTFEDLMGEFAHTGVVREARGREAEWTREQVANRQDDIDKEIVFETHDGRWMMRRDRLTATGDRVGIRTDVTQIKKHETELANADERTRALLSDLERTIDTMRMGIVLLDAELEAEIINKAFYTIWRLAPGDVAVGCAFRELMDINRHNGIYGVSDEDWEDYVARRVDEIRAGDVPPREFQRIDGSTLIYSVTALSGGKRLVCYYDVTDMKQREAELADALERAGLADAIVNGVRDPVFVKDEQMRFVFANQAFSGIFGFTPQEMIGKRAAELVGEDDAALFEASERVVLATGEPFEVEEDFETQGIGQSRIVRKHRIVTDSGKCYVSCLIFDVSDIRRREREAEEAHRYLSAVVDSLPAGIIIYDKADNYVLANRQLRQSLPALNPVWRPGATFREAILFGRTIGHFRASGDPRVDALYDTDAEAWIDAYMQLHELPYRTFERQHADGRWFQAHDMKLEDGTFIGVRVDITELKEREAALRESTRENELFRSLIDNVPVAIYAKRPDLRLIYVNQGWCDLTGIAREDALGRTDAEVFGPEGEGYMRIDRMVLENGEMQEVEELARMPDGESRFQIARKSTMIASDGSLYLIGSTTDVTELKRREEELREAEKRAVLADRAKSEFLANMSHEIRTPMNGVLGMAELLARTELDNKQRTFTEIIVKSGNALLTIINDILDFSKIDAGQLVLDPAPFPLVESVEDVATLMATRAKEKDLELIVRVDPDLPRMVVGDAGRLRQIITNLVGNAVKFTDSGHVLVEVTGAARGDDVSLRFRVQDTGIGIPQEKLAQVFEKFSQVDASSTRRHEGTGLGLAITSRLVELMGGEIGVESRLGGGSTFWFTISLPIGDDVENARIAPVDVTGARILIVDDNAVNRSILMEQMVNWGFDACAARNGVEALAVLESASRLKLGVDCAVLDYQMPGMSGVEVAERIRATGEIADTPIVMLTSIDQALSGNQFAELRIGAQLIKPARSQALLETLVTEIQKHRGGSTPIPAAAPPSPKLQADPTPTLAPASDAKSYGSGRRLDILVAEDNEVNQLVFAQMLSETSYTYEIVRNGCLAVEAHGEMRPGMILMDVSMPQMNGLEATQAIREAEAAEGLDRVPIVGVTAHALKGDRERCIAAGMDDYLSKPISPNALMEKIRRWLQDDAARREAG